MSPSGRSLRVAIAGGSLGGLFAATLLKRAGHAVRVFERSPAGLDGRGAGLVAQNEIFDILRAVGNERAASVGVVARERITLDAAGRVIERNPTPQTQVSWDHLYKIFRGLLSDTEYALGRGATAAGQDGDGAWLELDDGERIAADLVLGADGLGSQVREAVTRGDTGPLYAGYIAWRGLIPETELDASAASTLLDRFTFFDRPGSHALGYGVSGPRGETLPGLRRYNWVWYRPVRDLPAALTDIEGRPHRFSLSRGAVPPLAVRAMLEEARTRLPPQFLAAVASEPEPFIQAVFDYETPRMVLGRIALLGDAAFVVRPHTAMGAAKAAGDAMALTRALERYEPDEALARYAREREPVGRAVAAYGRRLGGAFAEL